MRIAALALLLVLAACGGGSDEPAAAPAKSTKTAKPAASKTTPTVAPTPQAPTGVAVPEALSKFRCEQDKKGVWAASGFVENSGKTAATFQVTVYIGEVTGSPESAKTLQLANVAKAGSVPFTIKDVPAPKDGGPCHVQVVVTK